MSVTQQQITEENFNTEVLTRDDVDFEQTQAILHGEYHQSHGTVYQGIEEYDVTITEKDDKYMIQLRSEETGEIAVNEYLEPEENETPRDALPENEEELYDLLVEDI